MMEFLPLLCFVATRKARPPSTFNLPSLSHAQDIHASAAAKPSSPGSYEHRNRERKPPKLSPSTFIYSGAGRPSGFRGATTWLLDGSDPRLPLLPSDELLIGTTSLHCTARGTTRTTGTMSTNITSPSAAWYAASRPLFLVIKFMMISVVNMFMMLRSHVHLSDVTNLVLVFF
jgi:hypothetical protein